MTAQDRPLHGAWGMTALLFLFMVVNFADKTVLQLCAVPLIGLTLVPVMVISGIKLERSVPNGSVSEMVLPVMSPLTPLIVNWVMSLAVLAAIVTVTV